MQKLDLLYGGKAKKVFSTCDNSLCIFEYKDDATAFNGEKKGSFVGKGIINNKISNIMFKLLQNEGIETHFVKQLSDRETLVKKVDIIPLEVIVRNISCGSFCRRYGVDEGIIFKKPCLEFSYKNDELGDPLINNNHIEALSIITKDQIAEIEKLTLNINKSLQRIFKEIGITLVDFKIETGFDSQGKIILSDEISPDTCRLWDIQTGKKLDKDRFRLDLGEFSTVYNEVFNRLLGKYKDI